MFSEDKSQFTKIEDNSQDANKGRLNISKKVSPLKTQLKTQLVAVIFVVISVAACSSTTSNSASSNSASSNSASSNKPKVSGTANVGYAGSLQVANENVIGPNFSKTTGYKYVGQGAGALAVAQYIIGGQYSSNVFESIGGNPIALLEPKYTNYYIQFAASPLVIAYNPNSQYASQFNSIASGKSPISALFSLLSNTNLKVGRTDPNVDPQGQAFLLMTKLAESQLQIPSNQIDSMVSNSQIFAETSLESTLQAGQLDAASSYMSQAIQLHLPFIKLPDSIDLANPSDANIYSTASITLTTPPGKVVKGSPLVIDITTINQTNESPGDKAAANAFVAFILSKKGLSEMSSEGFGILTRQLIGNRSSVSKSILSELK